MKMMKRSSSSSSSSSLSSSICLIAVVVVVALLLQTEAHDHAEGGTPHVHKRQAAVANVTVAPGRAVTVKPAAKTTAGGGGGTTPKKPLPTKKPAPAKRKPPAKKAPGYDNAAILIELEDIIVRLNKVVAGMLQTLPRSKKPVKGSGKGKGRG